MSEELKEAQIQEPADDAVVVHDEMTEEQSNAELVAKVSKVVGRDEYGDSIETDDAETGELETEETPSKDEAPKEEKKPALSKDLQARAEKAGLTSDLVEALHQSGQLEATLTAFDRSLIERFQAPEKKEPEADDQEELPDLDPEVYDEEIVKRDAHHKRRIDALESKLEELLQERQSQFDDWFDGVLTELGYDIEDADKCQKTFKAYKGICEAHGVSPESRDKALAERAHAAMFPEEVAKKVQKETVNRLRDAEGKFLSSSKSKGAPPPKDASPEEVHDHLVSQVASYLKQQGVQMSGY